MQCSLVCLLLVALVLVLDITNNDTRLVVVAVAAANNDDDKNKKYDPDMECGVWLAPSTIPNAGFGMFAGKPYDEGEWIADEMVIPLYDMPLYNSHLRNVPFFLWELYWWDGPDVLTTNEALVDGMGIVAGFGSAPNTILALLNIQEKYPSFQNSAGLHRAQDAGAGAFSEYGGRATVASKPLAAGDELFVEYGYFYFRNRPWYGPVPLHNDLKRASKFFQKYLQLKQHLKERENEAIVNVNAVVEEAWDIFVRNNTAFSRILGAFYHHDRNELKVLEEQYDGNLEALRLDQSRRPVEWLRQHGGCGDHLTYGDSTIAQAGRGAFARRFLPKGTLVAPMPLIHVPRREILDTWPVHVVYDEVLDQDRYIVDRKGKKSAQLLLNYCFGHKESTMLLCPYGMYLQPIE